MFLCIFWNINLSVCMCVCLFVCVSVCVCVCFTFTRSCLRDRKPGNYICEIFQGITKSYFWYYLHAFQMYINGSTYRVYPARNLLSFHTCSSYFNEILGLAFLIEAGQFLRKHLILWTFFLQSVFSLAPVSTLFFFRT